MTESCVFTLYYLGVSDDGEYERGQLLGVFSTSDGAEAAITEFRRAADFVEPGNGAEIVDFDCCVKTLSLYSSREAAEAAPMEYHPFPGFPEPKHRFEIYEEVLERDSWAEGFISWAEAAENGDGNHSSDKHRREE